MTEKTLIPVTVLTGYLGAGKTTLLNRILSEDHGRRYAVIVNEFGEIGIDNELILNTDEELFEMNNGCICCTVRGDLIRTLHGLLAKTGNFDAIVVETTGLADPGPVAQTFFVDGYLRSKTELDSVTTVVDAKHVEMRLADSREALEQIAFADQIVLNKTDLVTEGELRRIEAHLHRLNPMAPIHRAQRSNVSLDAILGRGGFDLNRITELEPDFLRPSHGEAGHVHDAHCEHDHDGHDDHGHHDHEHDHGIQSVALKTDRPMDRRKIAKWLTALVKNQGQDILRAKGIIDVDGNNRRLVFQAVHMILEGDLQREWRAGEARYSRMVFIGRNLDAAELKAGFEILRGLKGASMALFVISYIDKPDSLALRMANREAHLAYAHADDKPAKVKLGGPYLDEKGDMAGSLLIVEAPDRAAALGFTESDPYVKAGLFSSIDVRPFRVTMSRMG